MNFKKVGKRQASRLLQAAVKKHCSEIQFENKLLLPESLVHNLKAIKHNEYVEKECEKISSNSESSEVDSLDCERLVFQRRK